MQLCWKYRHRLFWGGILVLIVALIPLVVRQQRRFPPAQEKVVALNEWTKLNGQDNIWVRATGYHVFSDAEYYAVTGEKDYWPDWSGKAIGVRVEIRNDGKKPVDGSTMAQFPISYAFSTNGPDPNIIGRDLVLKDGKHVWIGGPHRMVEPGTTESYYPIIYFLDRNETKEVTKHFDEYAIYYTVGYYPVHQRILLRPGKNMDW